MARKQKFDYFQAFVDVSDRAVDYASQLVTFLESALERTEAGTPFDANEALERYNELHRLETDCDEVTHSIITALTKEFVPPIDRGDMMTLAKELDDVVDAVDEVLQRMYMYDVKSIRPEAVEMAHIVEEATRAVQSACSMLSNFKKMDILKPFIVKINDCEEEGDQVYIRSMHQIYSQSQKSLEAYGWGGVLASLEKCCDACETVADTIVLVVTKNA